MAGKKSKGEGPLASIEAPVMGIAGSIPLPHAKTWASMYLHPEETYEKNRKDAGWGKIITNFALAGLVMWVALFISMVLGFGTLVASTIIVALILYPVVFAAGGIISSVLYWIIAKLVGGKGSFIGQTHAFALLTGGAALLSFPFVALGNLPLVGWLFGLAGLLVGLYNIYNYYLIIRKVHEVSSLRAVIVIVVPIIIGMIIAFALAAAMVAMFTPYLASGPTPLGAY